MALHTRFNFTYGHRFGENKMEKRDYLCDEAWKLVSSILKLEGSRELEIINNQVLKNDDIKLTAHDCVVANKEMDESRLEMLEFLEKSM